MSRLRNKKRNWILEEQARLEKERAELIEEASKPAPKKKVKKVNVPKVVPVVELDEDTAPVVDLDDLTLPED